MPTRKIQKSDWESYFDRVSRDLPATEVEVEVDGLDLGAQIEVTHLPLSGLTYDPHDDAFSVVSTDIDHRISAPREIWVEEDASGIRSIEVVDGEGHKQIVKMTRALPLPPPHAGA